MITNKLGLPAPIVRAVENDPYTSGGSDISATALIDSPKIVALKKQHAGELVEDAADRIWSLIGQATHTILERASTDADISERRLFAEVDGWKLSGQFDLLSDARLMDFKITSVWTVIHANQDGKPEWENQLNVLDWLCRRNGLYVEKLEIVAILRDWSQHKAHEENYPSHQIAVIPVDRWTDEEQEAYIRKRVQMHKDALENLPECSAEERWEKPAVWAVKKKNRKSAIRLFPTETEAHEYGRRFVDGYYLEHRPGDAVRCSKYCSVANFCDQWRNVNG